MKLKFQKGVTLVELMITVSIFSLVILAVTPIFTLGVRQSSSIEARNSLKTEGQNALRNISRKLQQSKRIFKNSIADNEFLARVQLSSAPAALAGSKLPIAEETGALSPSTSTFVAASVGNRLFFTNLDSYEDMSLLDSGGVLRNVRIDQYRFNYYYLASGTGNISGKTKRNIWEWRSVPYADYTQLMAISNVTLRTNTALTLHARGTTRAWDSSATNVNSAFYTLSPAGVISSEAGHLIPYYDSNELIKPLVGTMGSSYKYTVSANTSSTFLTTKTVPEFGVASAEFPSGFEVVLIGPTSARSVLMRLVLVAQGTFKGLIDHEDLLVITARDVW